MKLNIAPKSIPKPLALEVMAFEVDGIEVKLTKNGDQMIVVKLQVTDSFGVTKYIKDYLITSEDKNWRLYKFADAIGMREQFESGEIDTDDLVGMKGYLKVNEEAIKDSKDNSKRYIVEHYVPMLVVESEDEKDVELEE